MIPVERIAAALDDAERLLDDATPGPWCEHNGELWCRATREQLTAYDQSSGEEELWPEGADILFHGSPQCVADAELIASLHSRERAQIQHARDVLERHKAVERRVIAFDFVAMTHTDGPALVCLACSPAEGSLVVQIDECPEIRSLVAAWCPEPTT